MADLPTAFAVAPAVRDGMMVGQLPNGSAESEQLGIVLDKNGGLTRCVSFAVESLCDDGTLGRLQNTWLADAGKPPVLT